MRAIEFLGENASAGATSSGNVASVAMPQQTRKGKMTFFGAPLEDSQEYGSTEPVVLRRPNPLAKVTKKD